MSDTSPLPPVRRAVLLLHQGHGETHVDILLERDDGPLLAFRAPADAALLLGPGHAAAFQARRLPDHRRLYLDYQGPVSNNRGIVRRLATHPLRDFTESPDALRFTVAQPTFSSSQSHASGCSRWSGRLVSDTLWRLEGRGTLD